MNVVRRGVLSKRLRYLLKQANAVMDIVNATSYNGVCSGRVADRIEDYLDSSIEALDTVVDLAECYKIIEKHEQKQS